jgi:hypothetical protein
MPDRQPDEAIDVNHPRARKVRRVTATALVALLGLAVAAGITYAASRLVSQPIGLSSEPQRIGDSLGPPAAQTTTTSPRTTTTTSPRTTTSERTTTTTTTQSTTTTSTPTSDDDSHTRERSGGRGDGDNDADD